MQCSTCKAANRDGIQFCEECGARLSLPCPSCGSQVPTGKKFCGICGAALGRADSTSPALLHPHPTGSSPAPINYTPDHLAERILSGRSALEGERKIVTVLFSDIRGSMDIMEQLDPEEAKRLLDPCLQLMMQAVHRFEGTVNRILGDGIMALFGAPLALEDHPQRALYAALEMHEQVGRYAADVRRSHGIGLQIRVGINTGEVVVRTIGDDLCMDYSAVGHAVGLAARMESLAAPGSSLVTAETHALTRAGFRFEAKGRASIKGVSSPLATYALLGASATRSRRAAHDLSPLVGRSHELEQLDERVALAAGGRGQIVSLVGEAGVGKSRLLAELKATLHKHHYLLIEGAAFPYGRTRAYLPWIEMFKQYCRIGEQDDPATYRTKLLRTLTPTHAVPDATLLALLLELLGVESQEPMLASLPFEARLHKVETGIKRQIVAESRRQPLVFLLEDLQWLDRRSLDFLHSLLPEIHHLPVLFLLSYRPGQRYGWESLPFSHRLQLSPLPDAASQSLLNALLGTDPSVRELLPVLGHRAGGNPFFLEETVQHLVETGLLVGRAGSYRLSRPVSDWALPATVQGVLASRMDRLDPSLKQVLQTAAVIGREVSLSLLARVMAWPQSRLEQASQTLHSRDFVRPSAAGFTFKHGLTQEVAYTSLLREQRAALHARVGAALEELYATRLQEQVTVLAYHYSRSTDSAKADTYLYRAGLRAVEVYADTDAQHFWHEHLRLLATLTPSPDRDRREVRTRLQLISLLSRHSNADEPIQEQFVAVEAACGRLADTRLLATGHAIVAGTYVVWGRPRAGLSHARTAYRLTAGQADMLARLRAHGPLAHLLWLAGRFEEGLQIASAGLDLIQHHRLLETQPSKSAASVMQCLAVAGLCHGFLGDLALGFQQLGQAKAVASQHLRHLPQALPHWGLALLHALRGEADLAEREASAGLDLMREVGAPASLLMAGAVHEYAGLLSAAGQAPIPSITSLAASWQQKGVYAELIGSWYAEALLGLGRGEEALRVATAVLVEAEHSHSHWFVYSAHRVLGRMLAQREPSDRPAARTHLTRALDYAQQMHSRPFQAHSALALGEFLARSGQVDDQRPARAYLSQAADLCAALELPADGARARRLLADVAQLA